ncbi:MAG: DUF6894 family protein [Sphingomicrobium sp.]
MIALYFFHLRDGGDTLLDSEGCEIGEPAEIGGHALKEARAMISQDALGGRIMLNQYIDVRNEAGKLIHQLAFRDAVKVSGL